MKTLADRRRELQSEIAANQDEIRKLDELMGAVGSEAWERVTKLGSEHVQAIERRILAAVAGGGEMADREQLYDLRHELKAWQKIVGLRKTAEGKMRELEAKAQKARDQLNRIGQE